MIWSLVSSMSSAFSGSQSCSTTKGSPVTSASAGGAKSHASSSAVSCGMAHTSLSRACSSGAPRAERWAGDSYSMACHDSPRASPACAAAAPTWSTSVTKSPMPRLVARVAPVLACMTDTLYVAPASPSTPVASCTPRISSSLACTPAPSGASTRSTRLLGTSPPLPSVERMAPHQSGSDVSVIWSMSPTAMLSSSSCWASNSHIARA
mmetsp:Transcript_5099/g.17165  ORF Transcript_5099/g.17165 Transcript_5099/m.17165 type:complete len:208 (+) Transcript_5099:157-780(+)